MSSPDPPANQELSLPSWEWVDAVCSRFEQDLQKAATPAERPCIEDFLADVTPSDRSALLRELLILELEYFGDDSQESLRASYQTRFPEDHVVVEAAFEWHAQKARSGSAGNSEETTAFERTDSVDGNKEIPTDHAVGRYLVRHVIARGGFGTVYLGHDPQLDRPVAIKVPRASWLRANDAATWYAEAKTAAQLHHPAIIAIHDVGESADAIPFVVMEYVEGYSLAGAAAAPFPEARQKYEWAAEVVRQVAEGVHYAHRRGFVHRDLKPANILLDTSDRPRIADFGLAVHESVQRGLAGQRSGTLHYMAPNRYAASRTGLTAGRTSGLWGSSFTSCSPVGGHSPPRKPKT